MPKQRNKKEENEAIKAHETPEGWEDEPHKLAQKDQDARWAKKGGRDAFRLQEPHQDGQRKAQSSARFGISLVAAWAKVPSIANLAGF